MSKDVWLPRRYTLEDGTLLLAVSAYGEAWQIFSTSGEGSALIALPQLAQKWFEAGLLDEALFSQFQFGQDAFYVLKCSDQYVLSAIEGADAPESKTDALAFAHAIKATRPLTDASFHDGIFVEQYSRILPVWSLTPTITDDIVLGSWLTGGVTISTKSFRRLSALVGWLPQASLVQVIQTAGLSVPDALEMTRLKAEQTHENEEPQPVKVKAHFELPGRPSLEAFFNEQVIDIVKNAEKYKALGVDFPSAIVLYGPPGCGKTFAVEKLVEFLDWPCYSIDSNSVGSPYIHATSKKVAEVFQKAIEAAPSVIVIDEMEAFLTDRSSSMGSGTHHIEEVAEFLRLIPTAMKNHVLVVGMTNLIDLIDPAILRRGRFDHLIEVGMPSQTEIESLLDALLAKVPTTEDLSLEAISKSLAGRALSDTAFVVREAGRLAAKSNKDSIDQACLEEALNGLPPNPNEKKNPIGFCA